MRDGFAPSPKQRQSIHFREPEVQQHGVVALGVAEKIRALAVGGAIHGVAGVSQRAFELPRETPFVFDHQHAHLSISS